MQTLFVGIMLTLVSITVLTGGLAILYFTRDQTKLCNWCGKTQRTSHSHCRYCGIPLGDTEE